MRPDYRSVILDNVPEGCADALDVGCGLGGLARRLHAVVPNVTGIDKDRKSIEYARAHADGVEYLHGDFLAWPFAPGSFDLITAMAALHHMDAAATLSRMRRLLRPGGVLVVIGLARGGTPVDLALTVPAWIGVRWHRLVGSGAAEPAGYSAPTCWPPPAGYRHMRRLAQRLLPGVRYRRHLYWRYSLVWAKPTEPGI